MKSSHTGSTFSVTSDDTVVSSANSLNPDEAPSLLGASSGFILFDHEPFMFEKRKFANIFTELRLEAGGKGQTTFCAKFIIRSTGVTQSAKIDLLLLSITVIGYYC